VPDEVSGPVSTPRIDESGFPPGRILAERYRIIGLVGRGGMGEVYRADDLKLGQPVALKFLPQSLEGSEHRLTRFLNEVRVARRVSHPHVCRVYDIGEVDGRHYLSMEYVDGEDLDSLMRRVGRLSTDKAVQIARQLCTGLAAAHRLGILHRDLKPANVMIDGRGQVRITDFGLAGLAADFEGDEIRVGTPSYMAPEQLAGMEVTQKSDIYSLGLVLYELFTGEAAFEARSSVEMARLHRESAPRTPSSRADGVDPAVERVILRCLEKDPVRRPASAMAVAVGLPGGDPLAAALEAGETPSPQLVADAGAVGGLSPAAAWACLAAFVVGLVGLVPLVGGTQLSGLASLEKAPAVLAERAREVVGNLGYPDSPMDRAHGFAYDGRYLAHIAEDDPSPSRWDRLAEDQPNPIAYWYRQSPRPIVRYNQQGSPSYWDPPAVVPGMIRLQLDPRGRLRQFEAVPPELDESAETASAPNWNPLFREAGLDLALFTPTEPVWAPSVYADHRAAWEGEQADPPHARIRVEAAAVRGRPVAFRIIRPWTQPRYASTPSTIPFGPVARTVALTWFFAAMIGAAFVARRNLRLGRGDRKGAFRLALYMLCTWMLAWLFGTHHVAGLSEIGLLTTNLAVALYIFCLAWIFYIAL
jgi:serine/threonine-protein kinase